jgi:hypothetical protein
MHKRVFVFTMLLTAPLLAATSVQAAEPCVFDTYAPATATPYSEEASLPYGSYSFMRGAQLFIPAQKGLTREWLQTAIERALTTRPAAPVANSKDALSCSPNVKDVRVAVTSAGNGFWVTLIGRDQKAGEALLKWAKSYVARTNAHARERVTR